MKIFWLVLLMMLTTGLAFGDKEIDRFLKLYDDIFLVRSVRNRNSFNANYKFTVVKSYKGKLNVLLEKRITQSGGIAQKEGELFIFANNRKKPEYFLSRVNKKGNFDSNIIVKGEEFVFNISDFPEIQVPRQTEESPEDKRKNLR